MKGMKGMWSCLILAWWATFSIVLGFLVAWNLCP